VEVVDERFRQFLVWCVAKSMSSPFPASGSRTSAAGCKPDGSSRRRCAKSGRPTPHC
jgi:hypothetical protein